MTMPDSSPGLSERALTIRTVESMSALDRAAWDRLANPPSQPHNPLISWDFLELLEASRCVHPRTGWRPLHVVVEDERGALIGAAPSYLKSHSMGEFVFDHAWADAYERAGGQYYPKLLVASPFSPVTGPRLLTGGDGEVRTALLRGLEAVCLQLGLSSFHVTFPPEDEWRFAGELGLLQRTDQQFMWYNRGYATFDDFLGDLASRKRKNLKKERAAAQEGLRIERLVGEAITDAVWDAFFVFYMDTGARKWGSPYLTREAFALMQERMGDQILIVMAYEDDTPIAGALNIIGGDALFGRYWGRTVERPFLHFEVCYYQAIDEAIARGLARVEAGAGGGHKMARGYGPTPVYSYHWVAHDGLRRAVAHYLEHERAEVAADIDYLDRFTPFKKGE